MSLKPLKFVNVFQITFSDKKELFVFAEVLQRDKRKKKGEKKNKN